MKYPSGIKKNHIEREITYGNRGMSLEEDLNQSNAYYREIGKAYIYKKPTPIKVTKVVYPSRREAIIKEAFFEMPSTTDYNGIYHGFYIDFEAKETTSKTSFPLANIHPHQIEHLRNVLAQGGICFLIVRFTTQNLTFLLMGEKLMKFLDEYDRKSIPLSFFQKEGNLIKEKYRPRIDYLEIVDQINGGMNSGKSKTFEQQQ